MTKRVKQTAVRPETPSPGNAHVLHSEPASDNANPAAATLPDLQDMSASELRMMAKRGNADAAHLLGHQLASIECGLSGHGGIAAEYPGEGLMHLRHAFWSGNYNAGLAIAAHQNFLWQRLGNPEALANSLAWVFATAHMTGWPEAEEFRDAIYREDAEAASEIEQLSRRIIEEHQNALN